MAFEKGNKHGKGRPTKVDEEKANQVFITALKQIYSKDIEDEAKVEFVKALLDNQRGQIFVAEHVFGKAPQEVKNTNLNIDEKDLTPEVAAAIKSIMENKY